MTKDTGDLGAPLEPETVSFSPSSAEGRALAPEPLAPGTLIDGKYLVEQVLGSGGMGVVMAARHVELGERVAIKLLHAVADRGAATRFRREARIALRMRSEHVARLMDIGRLPGGQPYLVMDYLEGESAAELVKRRALEIGEAVEIVLGACAGLAEAHRLGVIHRDLKPSNLFITRRTDGGRLVKVLDFGIAKLMESQGALATGALATEARPGELTAATVILGSPSFMAPEQIRSARDVDARADIWSLGVVLYELLDRELPFEAASPSGIMAAIVADPPRPLLRELPAELRAVVERCLDKDRARRFADVAQLARALAPHATGGKRLAREVERTLAAREPSLAPEERAAPARDEHSTAASWLVPSAMPAARRRWAALAAAMGAALLAAGLIARGPAPPRAGESAASLLPMASRMAAPVRPVAEDARPSEPAPEPSAHPAAHPGPRFAANPHAVEPPSPEPPSPSAEPSAGYDVEKATSTRK